MNTTILVRKEFYCGLWFICKFLLTSKLNAVSILDVNSFFFIVDTSNFVWHMKKGDGKYQECDKTFL